MQTPFVGYSRGLCVSLSLVCVLASGCAGGGSNNTSTTTTASSIAASLTISAVQPTDIPVGSTDTTIVVKGTGFTSTSVVAFNDTAAVTTFASATELHAALPASQLKVGAVLSVSVNNGAAVVKADPQSVAVAVDNPVPSLASVSPAAIPLGAADTTVTITGTSFVPGVALSVNGTTRTTTYVSSTQLTAQLLAADFGIASALPLNVINPKPGGGTSGTSSLAINNPVPVIAGVSPAAVLAGAADTTVTVTGTGLLPSTTLQLNGAAHAATVVSGTQLTFVLAAADLAAANTLTVTLSNPQPGGGISPAGRFAVQNPAPTLASVAPSTLLAGSDATSLVLTGTGYARTSTIQVNGSIHASTFVSPTEIDVPLSTAELATSGTYALAVVNPQPGGGTSPGASVPVNNPVPTIASLAPASLSVGSPNTPVTVTGTGFLPLTTLQIDGTPHAVTYVNGKQLTVTLTAAELAKTRNYGLTFTNPAPGGGTSASSTLSVVTAIVPVITTLAPAVLPVGSAATGVTITGTGFLPGSTVQLNGYSHITTYVSPTQMTLPLSAYDLQYYGTDSVVVSNPAPSSGSSNASTFTIQAKTPGIAAITPSSLVVNSGVNTLTVTGSNLTQDSIVLWNGTPLTTNYTYGYTSNAPVFTYSLLATVPSELTASTNTASITVSTPTAVAVSNAVSVAVTNPPVPTITSISPTAVPVNTDTKLTVYGTGFNKASVVSYNGTPVTTTFSTTTSLSATIPAATLALPGNGAVTVVTPAPGGGTSTAAALTVYVPIVSNNMVFNPVNGLAYLSIPSTGSTVAGNSIVSFDPATGALGKPLFVGSEPGVMAVSDDGTTLWVALNGTSAIRKVDLVNAIAGTQYSVSALNTYSGTTLTAILVLPGTTDSVAVSNGNLLGIYDAGVLRGATVNGNSVYALQADKSRNELYAGGYSLQAYTYDSTGLTLKSSGNTSYNSVASSNFDELQLAGGRMYTDFGKVYDPESSSLLGSLLQGTTTLSGPTFYDASLSQIYVLTNTNGYTYSDYTQVDLFNPTDYSNTGKTFQWNVPYFLYSTTGTTFLYPHRLVRWGANGLLLHTKAAMFTAQSNVIKDQSAVSADLSVTLASSGDTATGSTTTYTATVKNSGPQAATDVALSLQAPTTGVLISTTSSVGACSSLTGCTLGTLASGASATVTVQALQTTAGTSVLNASVQGSSTDPSAANNTATSSIAVTGATYNLAPTLTSLSPNAVRAGSADTTLTVSGTNFASSSTVMLGQTALVTKFVSSTQLTATVPAANLASMGWSPVTISTSTPGGGTSGSLALTVFNVVSVGLNHVVYEPFSRKLYASVSTGSSTITGSSVTSVDPATGTFGTPATFTLVPDQLALSTTGNTLYAAFTPPTTNSTPITAPATMGRLDLVGGTADTVTLPSSSSYYYYPTISGMAVQPGSDNAVAVSRSYDATALYDYNSTSKAFTLRGTASYSYNACINFLNAGNLIITYSSAVDYIVAPSSVTSGSTLASLSECFQLSGNTAATSSGKIFNFTSTAGTQLGSLVLPNSYYNYYGGLPALALDPSLHSAFYPGSTTATNYGSVDGILSYDLQTYLRTNVLSLNIPTIEGSSAYNVSIKDLIRWGKDGLALVTSTGHLYLLQGPFVVPQELTANSAATLSAASSTTLAKGSGNTLLTLTGTNFLPGTSVTWNGSDRTTTIVDATHVTVAIPASDLTTTGTGKLVATNPGAPASSALTVTVQ